MSASLQLVPDWADHSYCWMAWVVHPEWGKSTPSVKEELREVILTISKYEPVRLLTPPSFVFEARLEFVGANVEIVVAPVDDIWMRDIAPIYALHGTQSVPIDLNFNGWGSTEYRRSRAGDRLAGVCRHLFGEGVVHASFVAEGGAFVVGSNQLVFTTRSCLLNQNRNPFLNEQQIESGLLRLGARKVIWLKGDKNEKITAGHVDGYLLPTESGKVLFQLSGVMGPSRDADIALLRAATDSNGVPLELHFLNPPCLGASPRGSFFAGTYANVYTPNGAVVGAQFGDRARDLEAEMALRDGFPGREVKMLHIPNLMSGGGGIRCLVQPVPKLRSASG